MSWIDAAQAQPGRRYWLTSVGVPVVCTGNVTRNPAPAHGAGTPFFVRFAEPNGVEHLCDGSIPVVPS